MGQLIINGKSYSFGDSDNYNKLKNKPSINGSELVGDTELPTMDDIPLKEFASVSTVTLSSVDYVTYWWVTPTADNDVFGITVHPQNGRLCKMRSNKNVISMQYYDTNGQEKGSTKLFVIGSTGQGSGINSYTNQKVYIGTDNELYSNGSKTLNALTNMFSQFRGQYGQIDDTITDLNSVTGFYFGRVRNTTQHMPLAYDCYLLALGYNANYTVQIVTRVTYSQPIYFVRKLQNGTWSDWLSIDMSNVATKDEILVSKVGDGKNSVWYTSGSYLYMGEGYKNPVYEYQSGSNSKKIMLEGDDKKFSFTVAKRGDTADSNIKTISKTSSSTGYRLKITAYGNNTNTCGEWLVMSGNTNAPTIKTVASASSITVEVSGNNIVITNTNTGAYADIVCEYSNASNVYSVS